MVPTSAIALILARRDWRNVTRCRYALVVPRLRTPGAFVSTVATGATGGYWVGAIQRAPGGTADVSLGPPQLSSKSSAAVGSLNGGMT
jgi:hypothetical protein